MIYAPEPIIERDIDRAILAGRQADSKIWVAAFYVHRVWRTYEVDATAYIANECGKDKSTVENWAHAYEMYRQLRNKFRNANAVRKALTPSHFWTAWEVQRKYDMNLQGVMWELETMVNYKKTGETHGSSVLRQEVEAAQKRGGNMPTWAYYLPKVRNMYISLMVVACPQPVWDWLQAAPQEIKEAQ